MSLKSAVPRPGVAMLAVVLALVAGPFVLDRARRRPGGGPGPVRFSSGEELRSFAFSHGLHWHPGSPLPNAYSGYYVTDRPVTRGGLEALSKGRCGLTPRWDGVLWVFPTGQPGGERFDPDSVTGHRRVWGRIFVAGDERLMDRIEELYRQASRPPRATDAGGPDRAAVGALTAEQAPAGPAPPPTTSP